MIRNRRFRVGARPLSDAQSQSHFGWHKTGIAYLLELHETSASRKLIRNLTSEFHCQPGLADSSRSGQRQDAETGIGNQVSQSGELRFAPDYSGSRRWD